LSIPVLFALYPVAVALVALTFLRKWMPNPRAAYRIVLLVSFIFSLIDAAKFMGIDMSALNILPLFDFGMAWVLPTTAALVISRFIGGEAEQQNVQTA
ncbi:branched-chain amino acid transport system II carrier protein, partial [Photobacterium sp. OFAV2-7]|uniref:branched-chain amino acid transport system II carrier protein n=1 Tax=Photobacterium sp. OFAV2-7 TaxID=2917748 RepID=UPI001EF4DA85